MKLKKKYRLYLSKDDIASAESDRDNNAGPLSLTCPIAQCIRRHLKQEKVGVASNCAWIATPRGMFGTQFELSDNAIKVINTFDYHYPVLPTHFTMTQS